MGLSPSDANEPGAGADFEKLMAEGKRQLFAGKTTPATLAFALAAAAAPKNPLPFAYRSWAGRLDNKERAISDANKAVDLDPACAEAHMSLALAHATGEPDFEKASMALNEGRKLPPRDADGSVLSIGVYLIFADALASLREDADGFAYEFKPTPLRNAADRLLSGRHADAFDEFGEIHKSGRKSAGALGMAAACWAAGQKKYALDFAMFVDVDGAVKDPGVLAAARNIYNASQQ